MADDNDSLLREVQEEIRRERMEKIWQRYNGLIIGAAVLIVLAVGGYRYLETRRIASAEAAGANFAAAEQLVQDDKKEEAGKAFAKIAESGPAGYAALARFHIAGAAVEAGKTEEAIAAYESVAKNPSVDPLLKNFAEVQIAALQIGKADFTDVQNRLTPLASDDSGYKTTAQELLGLAAFKAGKLAEARQHLEPLLLDASASRGLQERVKIMLTEIARRETAAAPAVKSEAGSAAASKPDAAGGTDDKSSASDAAATAGDAKAAAAASDKPAATAPEADKK